MYYERRKSPLRYFIIVGIAFIIFGVGLIYCANWIDKAAQAAIQIEIEK